MTHPSEPNYLALFSGSTHSLRDDSCPHNYAATSLVHELRAVHHIFFGYSESMPSTGYRGCSSKGLYARKHNPWVDFKDMPPSWNKTFAAFPRNYARLPAISFVVPNLRNDMHDGTIQQGDSWLHLKLNSYAQWAKTHNSLLVVTWDEDDYGAHNHIPTIFVGAHVRPGRYAEAINHYRVLRTIEDAYHLGRAGGAITARPITDIWR